MLSTPGALSQPPTRDAPSATPPLPRVNPDPITLPRYKAQEEPTLIYARWAGYLGSRSLQHGPLVLKEHIYSAAIPPEKPLKLGMRVRVLATTPAWYSAPNGDPDTYDTYDAHIVGRIVGVAGWKGRRIVLEIENECVLNPVRRARIRLPFVPEVTVQLDAVLVPLGQREAQEADINTVAVVRARPGDARCGASACALPWRQLVGEDFLWEPMAEDVGEKPGIRRGRKKIPCILLSWEKTAEAEARGSQQISA